MTDRIKLCELADGFPVMDDAALTRQLLQEYEKSKVKLVVLDDDPTGIQTVHDVDVFTDWHKESVRTGFLGKNRMFFILTNSRSFTHEQTMEAHTRIAENIIAVSRETGIPFVIFSRSDSTMRGHYPTETQVLRQTLEHHGHQVDGEIICPFFKEGGRYTAENIHYVEDGGVLTPAGETEFAKDKTFGYRSSNICDWIEEKTGGAYKADQVTAISLQELRRGDVDAITERLMQVNGFGKVVVNAVDYCDLKVFCIALYRAAEQGKHFLFRVAASFVKTIGCISDKPLLTAKDLLTDGKPHTGLIIAGSHTVKTTAQLNSLFENKKVVSVIFNQHLVFQEELFLEEMRRVTGECERQLALGNTVAVTIRRERIDANTGNKEDELRIAVKISDAITSIVKNLEVRPGFIIAKGGITSSDIGTKALFVRRARVAGQVKPGVPVWLTGEESKFPGMPYIIFPGNVGGPDTLREIVDELIQS